jgi:hypothetical protein
MTHDEAVTKVREAINAYAKEHNAGGHLRHGQIAFNAVHTEWPEIAERFRGDGLDPFYVDGRTDAFVSWVAHALVCRASEAA